MLQASRFALEPFREIVEQIASRQRARHKLPEWYETKGLLYPPALSMEQCSSQQTARYKQGLFAGDRMADLTGGTGVDTWYLAKHFEEATYVEQNPGLCALAAHNFKRLGGTPITVIAQEAATFVASLHQPLDLIYLDPARRDLVNNRVFALPDCSPDVLGMQASLLRKAKQVLLKTAPMLDIKQALQQLQGVTAVHVVAVSGEVKEVLFVQETGATQEPEIHAVNIKSAATEHFTFSYAAEQETQVAIREPVAGLYLYEPHAAILKAGAFKSLAAAYDLAKVHAHSHLYLAKEPLPAFPGRGFSIQAVLPLQKKVLRKALPEGKVNITVRNFPMTVAQIRHKTGLKEGGEQYLFASTSTRGPLVIVCQKLN